MLNALLETSSCVYSEIMLTIISLFQKLKKARRGVESFSKINEGEGARSFSTQCKPFGYQQNFDSFQT